MKHDTQKTAVITGASKGIGFTTALALAKLDYNLVVCARNATDLETAMKQILKASPKITIDSFVVDVSERAQLDNFIQKINEEYAAIDILVNNAGLFIPGNIVDEEDGAFEKMLTTNLFSVYHLTRGLLPLLKNAKRGHIFNLGSVAGTRAYPNGGSYSISKFALHGFNENLRQELKPFNIKVTNVIPGATWSASWEGFDAPVDRLMQADDIAQMMVATLTLSDSAVVETITMRPQLGDL